MLNSYKMLLAAAHEQVCTYCKVKGHIRPYCPAAYTTAKTLSGESRDVEALYYLSEAAASRAKIIGALSPPTAQPVYGRMVTYDGGRHTDDRPEFREAVEAYKLDPGAPTADALLARGRGSLFGVEHCLLHLSGAEDLLDKQELHFHSPLREALRSMDRARALCRDFGLYFPTPKAYNED